MSEPEPSGAVATLDVHEKATPPQREHNPKARKHALMRRFDKEDSTAGALPRRCPSSAAAPTEAAVPKTTPAAPDTGIVAPAALDTNAAATLNATAPTAAAPAATGPCFPERAFVERLCSDSYPGVALVLFGKSSPWTRAYLKGPAKAWTTAPGAQAEEQLFFREEVLVLQDQQTPADGIQVSSGASFYALRWNGSCVKLTEEEITDQPPWQKATPPVNWQWLDDNIQDALLDDAKVKSTVTKMKKACRGSGMGKASGACGAAQQQVTDVIVGAVRGGLVLPDPARLP